MKKTFSLTSSDVEDFRNAVMEAARNAKTVTLERKGNTSLMEGITAIIDGDTYVFSYDGWNAFDSEIERIDEAWKELKELER